MRLSLLLALAASCAPDPASTGNLLHVRPAPGTEVDDPAIAWTPFGFQGIQTAIDAASSGATVIVPPGTYAENLIMREGVSVQGAGQGQTWLVGTVVFSGLTSSTLSSMSLVDPGYASGNRYSADGVLVQNGHATLRDLSINYFRHGIYANGSTGVVADDITASQNWYAAYVLSSTGFNLTNSLVTNNPAGGVATSLSSSTLIANNTLVGNGFSGMALPLSGAIALGSTSAEVAANNIITSNFYGINCYSCGGSWHHNMVWGNSTNYVNDASAALTDISTDPCYADPGEGNYHLSAGSPAIDVGDCTVGVNTDADGEARPQGGGCDIGLDEYAISSYDLILTEVMANARRETTGEFVEIFNFGSSAIDLAGLILTDGDDADPLQAYNAGTTVLPAGAWAVVLDQDFNADYTIDASVVKVTTSDTNLGNGLTTADPVTLFEPDGSTIISTFSHPRDPGDGISMEMADIVVGDAAGNWRPSQCTGGSSPGLVHCFPETGDPADLIITEIMANPLDEATGEYVEVYNPTNLDIDLAGLVFKDVGASDILAPHAGRSTILGPRQHGLILDAGYLYSYYLPSDVAVVTAGPTVGNGLTLRESVFIYQSDGVTLIDTFTSPFSPANGVSAERVDYAVGDVPTNWVSASGACACGSSPARLNGAAGGICEPLIITEVMANPLVEDTGEFVEIFNVGTAAVDLAGLWITDGTELDTLSPYMGGSTLLGAGQYAVVLDSEYAGEYAIPAGALLITANDTEIGNGLSISDLITLYEDDGIHVIDSFDHPFNPGNGFSAERAALQGVFDSAANWVVSTCAAGSSPGQANCASGPNPGATTSTLAGSLVVTEIMANPLDEATGEYVELYNAGTTSIDLLRFVLYDGDTADTIFGFASINDAVIDPGQFALILDADYAAQYTVPAGTLLMVTDDSTVGSGLSNSDPIYLYESDGLALIDSFSFPFDAGNGRSVEKVDITLGDVSTNWSTSICSGRLSPGSAECF